MVCTLSAYAANGSRDFVGLIEKKISLYRPDAIVYYEAINDALNDGWWPEDQIAIVSKLGNWRSAIHCR